MAATVMYILNSLKSVHIPSFFRLDGAMEGSEEAVKQQSVSHVEIPKVPQGSTTSEDGPSDNVAGKAEELTVQDEGAGKTGNNVMIAEKIATGSMEEEVIAKGKELLSVVNVGFLVSDKCAQ